MSNCAEVIIIGGGIIGSATAYYLAKKGCSVIVLEKSASIGNGGSSRNGGGVRQSGRDKREIPLARHGIEQLWPSLGEELGVNVEYHRDGNLRLGKTEAHRQILNKLADNANSCGVDVKMVSAEEVRQINPFLSDEVLCASWCPTDGHANPLTATLGFYKRAMDLGVRFITAANVLAIQKVKGRATQVVTEMGTYSGQAVLLTAGLGSKRIAGTVGIHLPMRPELHEALVTEAFPPLFWQMLGTAEGDFYGHQTEHGSFVIGAASGYEGFAQNGDAQASSGFAAPIICRKILDTIPRLKKAKIVRTWAGWLDMSADGVPVLGSVEEVPGLYLACMFTGHGFGIAPAVGNQMAQLIVDGASSIDLSALHYSRFLEQ
jgi:sarcosine oxidase, subunit beta